MPTAAGPNPGGKGQGGLSLAIAGCNYHPQYKDDFYNNDMADVSLRLPLVKPYEALKNGFWTVQLHASVLDLAADHIFVDPYRFIAGYGDNGTTVRRGETVPYTIYFLIDIKNKKGADALRFGEIRR